LWADLAPASTLVEDFFVVDVTAMATVEKEQNYNEMKE